MSLVRTVEALVVAGATPEMILAAVRAHEASRDADDAARREKAAAKKRRQRAVSPGQTGTDRDKWGQTGTNGDSPEGAARARPTCAQVVNPTSSLRSEGIPPEKPSVSTPKGSNEDRGARLPDNWRPDPAGLAYAADALGLNVDPERELDRFRDYWRAVPGAKGRKSDWPATWRNWCRNAADRLPAKLKSSHERTGSDHRLDAFRDKLVDVGEAMDAAFQQPRRQH